MGVQTGVTEIIRCGWTSGDDALMLAYHDDEWGVPQHDERTLFEFVVLEGAQAGLSWRTVLNKREAYRRAFADLDVDTVATFGASDVSRLLGDAGIIRNRAKIESTIGNAIAVQRLREDVGSLDAYLWSFVDGRPIANRIATMGDLPASTPVSDRMSKDMKRRGFRFVGTTICYSLMQACGLVNDHLVTCFRYEEIQASGPGAAAG
ncbi:MAG: DNA-3-methyladenine glycosylase [Acidimicrobiaceae bacterium]|nr:DNA-3-methyladenine glycosylase [Acidimicrobiaceae bacterium]